jgi:hypothetical protein
MRILIAISMPMLGRLGWIQAISDSHQSPQTDEFYGYGSSNVILTRDNTGTTSNSLAMGMYKDMDRGISEGSKDPGRNDSLSSFIPNRYIESRTILCGSRHSFPSGRGSDVPGGQAYNWPVEDFTLGESLRHHQRAFPIESTGIKILLTYMLAISFETNRSVHAYQIVAEGKA